MTMMERIQSEPKVTIRLPSFSTDVEEGPDTQAVVPVLVNGVYMQVARGEPVDVPVSMFEALKRTGKYDL